jgi:hypothetical protein
MKQADTDGTGGPDQQRLMYYSDRWHDDRSLMARKW